MYSMCRKLVTTYVYEETWQMLKFGGACDRTRRELGGGVVEESIIRNQYLRESSYSV